MDNLKKLMAILSKVNVSKSDFDNICQSDFVISVDSTGTENDGKNVISCYTVVLEDKNTFNIKVKTK